MRVKGIIWEDFINYFKPSTFIIMPYCSFKCDKECGQQVCQNSALAAAPDIEISNDEIITTFCNNKISEALVIGGLEPFDTFDELYKFLIDYKEYITNNQLAARDIVIYSGYNKNEIWNYLRALKELNLPIIVKFGRFIPNKENIYDSELGVVLSSYNQYAEKLKDLKLEEN